MVSSIVDHVLHVHGALALAIVFLLPFGESAIFLGFVFPGETAAILAGVLAYEHRIPLALALLAVGLGAILGDSVGYFVGEHWGVRLLEGPLARWVKPEHVTRTRDAVSRLGGLAVFVGRWTTALRVLVPGLAGVAGIRYRTFLLWNVIGGVCWAVTFVMLGYGAGASWHQVAGTAGRAGLIVLVVAIAVVVAAVIVRRRRRRSPANEAGRKHGDDVS